MDTNTLKIVRDAIEAQAQGKSIGGKVSALTAEYLNRVVIANGGTFSAIFKEGSDLSALEELIQAFHVAAGERYPERSGKDWSNCFSSLNMALGRLCKKSTEGLHWMSYKPKTDALAFKSKSVKAASEEALQEAFKAFVKAPSIDGMARLQSTGRKYMLEQAETRRDALAQALEEMEEILTTV